MAVVPLLLNMLDDFEDDIYSPSYLGNNFGMAVQPQYLHQRRSLPLSLLARNAEYNRLNRLNSIGENGVSHIGKDGFQVCMDVTQFKPSELTVKVVENSVVVEGKHEERADDHGYISRHFKRRYTLPKGYEGDKVVSTLSSDGVLTISAPKPEAIKDKDGGRSVQIQQVGPAHLNVKKNVEEKPGDAVEAKDKK